MLSPSALRFAGASRGRKQSTTSRSRHVDRGRAQPPVRAQLDDDKRRAMENELKGARKRRFAARTSRVFVSGRPFQLTSLTVPCRLSGALRVLFPQASAQGALGDRRRVLCALWGRRGRKVVRLAGTGDGDGRRRESRSKRRRLCSDGRGVRLGRVRRALACRQPRSRTARSNADLASLSQHDVRSAGKTRRRAWSAARRTRRSSSRAA